MFGSVVPQHCKWAELLQCAGLRMVVQVVEWECTFEMDVDGVVVVVEMNGKDNMEFGMEDIEENTEDIVDGSHKFLANLVAKIGFGVRWPLLPRKGCVPITLRWMCISLKF